MDKLTWDIQQILNTNKDGSFATQKDRQQMLNTFAKNLKTIGHNQMRVKSLREKHFQKMINRMKDEGKSSGTMKNLMSHSRWLMRKVGLEHRIPTNQKLGIKDRTYVTNNSKAVQLKQEHLDKINNVRIQYSLKLQASFGLRREEAMKFNAVKCDNGDKISLKASTTKGGRARDIPFTHDKQRSLINEIKKEIGNNSLIPADKSYIEQLNKYKNVVPKSGLGKGHGLRHNYAQQRYKELTGRDCPALGGKRQKDMTKEEREVDRKARLQISSELGHVREQITSVYLGS